MQQHINLSPASLVIHSGGCWQTSTSFITCVVMIFTRRICSGGQSTENLNTSRSTIEEFICKNRYLCVFFKLQEFLLQAILIHLLLFYIYKHVYLAWQHFYCTKLYFLHVCTPSSFSEEVVFNSFLECFCKGTPQLPLLKITEVKLKITI